MLHTPSGGAGSGTATSERAPMSIGAVLNQLRDEFPEVTLSKIRFLESEGLVEPQRTPAGYRKFASEDVERLSRVLRLQRDHYLPLKVIREYLETVDRGETPSLPQPAGPPDRAPDELGHDIPAGEAPAGRVAESELLGDVQATRAELAEWESYGLVASAGDGTYTPEMVEIARLVAKLGDHGLQARHLRAVRAAAEREAVMVEQLVAPLRKHRNPQTRTRAQETAKEMASLSVRLHAAFLHAEVRERLS